MKSKLLIVACLVIVLSMALILPLFIVNADYSDLINDPNSIVNFNQLQTFTPRPSNVGGITISVVDNWKINFIGTYSAGYTAKWRLYYDYVSLYANHKYYFKINSNSFNNLYLCNGDGDVILYNILGDFIYTPEIDLSSYVAFQLFDNNYYDLTCGVNIIDLSLMFGQNSEPSLTQCQDLFVADYYPYNTGSPLAIGNLQGYAQGMADAYSSMDITLNQYLVGSSAFAYNNTTITGSNITFDNNVNAYLFSGVIGIPLLDTVKQGTNFEVDFDLWNTQTGESASYYSEPLNFGYVDTNNNLITIASIPVTTFVSNTTILFKGSFVLPISTDTIYLWLSYDLRSDPNSDYTDSYIATKSDITFRSYNVAAMIKTSYSEGYNSVISYYQYGGQGYHDIYELGYTNGLNAENPYTFATLMSSVVEAPLQAVLSIFNFDFLGYNFRNVITLILTLCIILAIIRLFLGMGASE